MMVKNTSSMNSPIVLAGGTLIDGSGRDPITDSFILMNGNLIEIVTTKERAILPKDCSVIDVTGKTVMPGLFDGHVHLCFGRSDPWSWAGGVFPPLLEHPLPLVGIKGFARARRAFHMGFTTIRDMGDIGHLAVSVRNAINSGVVEGPRVLASGPYLNATSGFANPLPPWLVRTDVLPQVADGVDAMVKHVRTQVRMGVDWIKYVATGGMTTAAWDDQQFSDEEVQALVAEAHRKKRPVSAHCQQAKGALQAVMAGVDEIEHCGGMTEEVCAAMVKNGMVLVPTLSPTFRIVEQGIESGLAPDKVESVRALLDRYISRFKMAREMGVKMALGSDSGWTPAVHGENACELDGLVRGGMTPMEAVVTATSATAEALRLRDKLGTLEPGKLADIVVVDGNPLDDIKVLQDKNKISLVVKDGVIAVNRMVA